MFQVKIPEIIESNISDVQRKIIEKKLKKVNVRIKRLPKDKNKALENNRKKQDTLWKKVREIDEGMKELPQQVSRLETLIKNEYAKLNLMPKSFMDAVKINARNIIYQLLKIFRPIWNNYRNDLLILRELITAMGHIQENEKLITIALNPARQYTKKQKHKILIFLFEISNITNKYYNTDKMVVFTLYEL